MKKHRFTIFLILIVVIIIGASLSGYTKDEKKNTTSAMLIEQLMPLRPYIGKTWKGTLTGMDPEKPMIDISRWERALNGRAIRILHSVNNGVYGGETIILWDAKKKSLVFFYFTTGGFYTQGTMTFEAGKLISHERVTGNTEGITEVKAVGEMLPGGKMRSSSQYLKNGKWVDGHTAIYVEAPNEKVIFK